MTLRFSTGLRNNLAGNKGFASTFAKGSINIYSGTQPATADSPATGTLLGTASLSSGALTQEVRASQTITVAGAAGSINTVSVGGLNIIPDGTVAFSVDAATTATALCDAINRNGLFDATVSGAVVTVLAPRGAGVTYNAVSFATAVTTLTATVGAATMSGGVAAVNGLTFAAPASGAVSKSGIWSFNGAVAAGAGTTAGWFRLVASTVDAGGASTTLERLDGSIAVSGADMNLSNITIVSGAPNTIDTFTYTQPAQ
jgi:hypothetical protein